VRARRDMDATSWPMATRLARAVVAQRSCRSGTGATDHKSQYENPACRPGRRIGPVRSW